MSKSELIAKFESILRPHLMWLSPKFLIKLYSREKLNFLNNYFEEKPIKQVIEGNSIKLWDIEFNVPIFNAAGMFKNGYGYNVVANQGAGAYLFGTTTAELRNGNTKDGIYLPFAPYPNSGSASNWMGLPNESHKLVAKRISKIQKIKSCPIGASVSITGNSNSKEALDLLIEGMTMYELANVDFIELNESCPNVADGHHSIDKDSLDQDLIKRLEYISKHFLSKRKRNLPLILKLSNDTNPELIPAMIDIMLDLNYDGLNLGNTSTDYNNLALQISAKDKMIFDYFTNQFGGGVSGRVIKEKSLFLIKVASNHLQSKYLNKEFHLIRTGGIENSFDIEESIQNGASLCQWYTGYFANYAQKGHKLYFELFDNVKNN